MTHRCVLHVTVAEPADVIAVIADIERRGFKVECPAHDARERLRERDELLQAAHGLMSGTTWGRCVQLEAEIRRFESVLWPRWRDRAAPPEPCSALRRHLFEARQLGPLPHSARQVYNIVKRGSRGNFGDERI